MLSFVIFIVFFDIFLPCLRSVDTSRVRVRCDCQKRRIVDPKIILQDNDACVCVGGGTLGSREIKNRAEPHHHKNMCLKKATCVAKSRSPCITRVSLSRWIGKESGGGDYLSHTSLNSKQNHLFVLFSSDNDLCLYYMYLFCSNRLNNIK